MNIEGKRVRRVRRIFSEKYIVVLDVEMVIPDEDPSGACLEADTVAFLKEVKERADAGDLEWLKKRGKVYATLELEAA